MINEVGISTLVLLQLMGDHRAFCRACAVFIVLGYRA